VTLTPQPPSPAVGTRALVPRALVPTAGEGGSEGRLLLLCLPPRPQPTSRGTRESRLGERGAGGVRAHRGAMVIVSAAVRAKVSGVYISSTRVGGVTKVPICVARATYRKVLTPAGSSSTK